MKVILSENDIVSTQLSWLCVKPILEEVRGKEAAVKKDAYNRLNDAQKALYLFYAFHNHTNTTAEFYWFASYFVSELKGWRELTKGLLFYGEEQLVLICNEMEQVVTAHNKQAVGTWRQALASDLDHDTELLGQVARLYEQYRPSAEKSIQRMNEYVKSHSEQFYHLEAQERGDESEDDPISK
ncbi:hypothetical protein [Paenibacillus luteus]|uniref:hypothetical protein n=1 Tax=Paenibacillus luteus TaxID=2545753 RepID=UPI001144F1BD|nr:hypothetical protein [Paenibacillus luteus]